MLQWFIRFPEFAELTEKSALFRENSIAWDNKASSLIADTHLINFLSDAACTVFFVQCKWALKEPSRKFEKF